jgi:uncharacterized protein YdaU (DUF1376 family)
MKNKKLRYIDITHLISILQPLLAAERGAYSFVAAWCEENGSLADDDAKIAAMMRMPLPEWQAMRPKVQRFFEIKNGRWIHNDPALYTR